MKPLKYKTQVALDFEYAFFDISTGPSMFGILFIFHMMAQRLAMFMSNSNHMSSLAKEDEETEEDWGSTSVKVMAGNTKDDIGKNNRCGPLFGLLLGMLIPDCCYFCYYLGHFSGSCSCHFLSSLGCCSGLQATF